MAREATSDRALPGALTTRDVRTALRAGALQVVFQPVVDFGTRTVRAVETLIRWDHPEHGWLLPGQFLPACDPPLLAELGLWVLEQAVATGAHWRATHGAGAPIVGVNVDASQLDDPGFVPAVLETLARHGLPGSALTVELTETASLTDPAAAVAQLQLLREAGVLIALDDFGTGYSGLARLRALPVDVVKVDGSFIAGFAAGEPAAEAIVATVLTLAGSLGLWAVVEGVEDQGTAQRLAAAGAVLGQGFALGRPVTAAAVAATLLAA